MFSGIKKWIEDRIKIAKVTQKSLSLFMNPGFIAAKLVIDKTLFENSYGLSKTLSLNVKKSLQKAILDDILTIYQTENPLLENRRRLIESVLEMATYGVLILNCDEDLNHFCSHPAISGELRFYLDEISKKDENIKKYITLNVLEGVDLHSTFLIRHWHGHLLAEVYRALRYDFEGKIECSQDWYKPFIFAMYICKEDEFRKILGLSSLAKNYFGELGIIQNSLFINILLSEEKDPLAEFEKLFA